MENEQKRNLSIAEWYRICLDGTVIPVTFRLGGMSMEPLIRKNKDDVTVIPTDRSLKKGDIVLFKAPDGRYTLHRIYKINDTTVTTLGDNCLYPDKPFPKNEILGRAVSVKRNKKTLDCDGFICRFIGKLRVFLLPSRRLFDCVLRKAVRIKKKIVKK